MIFLFDLDGTIVFKGQPIDKRIVKALRKLESEGHQIIFASARPIRDMLPLTTKDFPHNFLIGGNGSIIQSEYERKIVGNIPLNTFCELKELILKYDLDYLVDSEWNYSLKNRNDVLARINDKVDTLKLARNVKLSSIKQSIKCIILNIPNDLYEILYKQFSNMPLNIIKHEEGSSIDLTAENINKYTTFRKFFPSNEFFAFGNDYNDIEILMKARKSITIGENKSVMKLGDVNLPSDNSKIAYYIENFKT